ncbi:CzcE family metal-binding protein [Glaciimonas sp. Gout2]|uniref:CzcE family metal-binding protein n=1 Tax=unclassified Glaciimonas TaxID=2644401 RepID=UPI002AB3B969|nr:MULTISPECIES: CzcE family metal-binding protein [unclassified Glaciimonas]MDY7547611.1 CzcE family metal-binding protein [Glaciimonas sp. CA11.2]MEB0014379.1 CzcE family metal-binding protein [Glaciimonas sp. Cout2]MEB0084337.1 CzcE family metal-binding protein [Glaciimonas sp. Gout2]
MNPKHLIAVLAMLTASASTFAGSVPKIDLLGDSVPVSTAFRTIVITPDTKYVNVTGGQTVRFIAGDKSFAWNFDGAIAVSSFVLNRAAPASMLDHKVIAYVAPNPLYLP